MKLLNDGRSDSSLSVIFSILKVSEVEILGTFCVSLNSQAASPPATKSILWISLRDETTSLSPVLAATNPRKLFSSSMVP